MPDFQFSEENPAPAPPPQPAPAAAPSIAENPMPAPAKTSGFQLLSDAPLAPETPIAEPSLPRAPAVPTPIAGPPLPKLQPPAPPVAAPKVPTPPTPTVSTPPTPIVPTPSAPVAAPAVAAPTVAPTPVAPAPLTPRPLTPARPAANAAPADAPRAAPVPIALTLPIPNSHPSDTISDETGAPQDDFSRKIWDLGQKIKVGLDALEAPASWLLRLAVVIGMCALAYILAATLMGGAGTVGNPKMAELTRNLDLASKAFVFSLLGAAVASLLLGYEDNRLGALVAIIGVIFHFVMPIALKKFVGNTPAVGVMAVHFRQGGYFLVMIGVAKAICDTAIWLWNLPDRMKQMHASVGVSNQAEAKQRIVAREANMLSPCWRLPFCRESIRKQCPAFLAKKTCWKFGRGCYCDTEMISRIVRGESLDLIKAPTQQSRQGKPPCGRCYIYLEHQTYKFRVLSPLALPLAVASTWLIWPVYTRFFAIGDKVFNSLWSSLSFNTASLATGDMKSSQEALDKVAALGNNPEDIARIAQNMFGMLLGFMLLIYISKFIEWAIYKAKW